MRHYDIQSPENRIVGKILHDQAQLIGDHVWLLSGDRRVTFREANAIVNRYTWGLDCLEVKKGDSVALLMEPSIEAILVAIAVTRHGALFTTINTDYHKSFLEEALLQASSSVLIVDGSYLPRLDQMQSRAGIRHVVCNGEGEEIKSAEPIDLASWLEHSDAPLEERAGWLDPVQCWWSSGTTGKPKGIVHSHSSVIMQCTAYDREYEDDEVLYACTPIYLGSAWSGTIWPSLVYGLTAAIDARFSVSQFWNRIRHYKATQAFTLGAMHILLWKQPPNPMTPTILCAVLWLFRCRRN